MATTSDHLCVLVHGLWGNPSHLKFLSTSLREQYPEDKLHILVVKRNAGSFTYDGIETGGERVAHEIEEYMDELSRKGSHIKKLSIVGYSLGGLIARYAIGLLFSNGIFDRVQPVNFTTFATPHLGVRTPLTGRLNHVWNVLGARTLSMSGRQLFTIDQFRDTGRPLLAVLADPESIFIKALKSFKNRSLYANIVNDRTVVYYTAGISQTDPFKDLDAVQLNYLSGYDSVIVDGENPISPKDPAAPLALAQRLTQSTHNFFKALPFAAFLIIFIPIGSSIFFANTAIQSVRSRQRIQLHESGNAGPDFSKYRIPFNEMRKEVEDMFENVNNTQSQAYLPAGSEQLASPTQPRRMTRTHSISIPRVSTTIDSDVDSINEHKTNNLDFPTLALTADQFAMIESLDNVGFRKHPVHIKAVRHTHAAIIRRMDKKSFNEGRAVARHWIDNFEL